MNPCFHVRDVEVISILQIVRAAQTTLQQFDKVSTIMAADVHDDELEECVWNALSNGKCAGIGEQDEHAKWIRSASVCYTSGHMCVKCWEHSSSIDRMPFEGPKAVSARRCPRRTRLLP